MEVAGANRRWRCQFRCRGSRRESAVAQLFSLGRYAAQLQMNFDHSQLVSAFHYFAWLSARY